MLSNQEIKELGRGARVSLDQSETEILCRDLNALLEMSAVLESLPQVDGSSERVATLAELREDVVVVAGARMDTGKDFSVPPVMEKT